MTSASMFTIHNIPKKFDDEALLRRYMDKYKELRLLSLKSDPDAFSSFLARESKQPHEFWTGRMLNPRVRQLVAVRLNMDSSANAGTDGPHDVLETEWVGTLVVLGPKTVTSDEASPWTSLASGRFVEDGAVPNSDSVMSACHLAGFYVAPEARGQGLGSMLVRAAIASIVQESQTMHNARAICTVSASHTNLPVRRLFKKMGFMEIAEQECKTEDGRHLTEVVMRRDLIQ